MAEESVHTNEWQDSQLRLANRSAEENFFDAIGGAAMQFANAKKAEAEKWKTAYEKEAYKNKSLVALLRQHGIPVPDFDSICGIVDPDQQIVEELKPYFFCNTDEINKYLSQISMKKDFEVVSITNQFIKNKVISNYSCGTDLYNVLHKYGYYTATAGNWNRYINK